MGDTNYFSGVVKILEKRPQIVSRTNIVKSRFIVEISQTRKNKIASVIFWGNLVNKIENCYKANDYLLIEVYIYIEKKKSELKTRKPAKLIITVLKVYPFLLNSVKELENN